MPDMDTAAAKRALGIDRLVLQIHDASFPSDADEDWGRGSPYSRGAERFFAFAAKLGFDAIQLGPQGLTQRGNASPYDATLFSRNPLNLPLGRFVEQGRLRRATLAQLVDSHRTAVRERECSHAELYDRFQVALAEIIANADAADRASARDFLAANEYWLIPDALYEALCREHGEAWWGNWGRTALGRFDQRLFAPAPGDEAAAARRIADLRRQYDRHVNDYALIQWWLALEHQALRERLAARGLTLWADLQVGLAPQDAWARQALFLPGYQMGAPPSRTNPAGQPWGYSVYDPRQLGTAAAPGPALDFVRHRLDKTLAECDGVRIDHPHGWVDPWVYRSDDPDPLHAVQNGARLFSSPCEPEHAELGPFAIAVADQIDETELRHADRRVRRLDEDQVARYSLLIDLIVEQARKHGRSPQAIACEVLSTLPYPIERVLERHGLGRFRVIQKAKLQDPTDVYRIENSQPHDWIMLGTHDTPTIWALADRWCSDSTAGEWWRYLESLGIRSPANVQAEEKAAGALLPTAARKSTDALESTGVLVQAIFQAMLASRARNVMVFFADLFGMKQRYNEPGVISESNWSIGLPSDFEATYESGCRLGTVLDVVACLENARRAQSAGDGGLAPPAGATIDNHGTCWWRLWAPQASSVRLLLCDGDGRVQATHDMTSCRATPVDSSREERSGSKRTKLTQSDPLQSGWFEFSLAGVRTGQRYLFQIDDRTPRPDPASRWQPDGVHKPSAVWDPREFAWSDQAWRGVSRSELVIYELHVGAFTPEGTFAAIIPRLRALRELGVTAIELMPVAQFPGSRGWGYDGVHWYAPQNSYGGPTELQRLVDACHAEGLAAILDVVYNHLGPEGNYSGEFGPYVTDRHHTAWGPAINFDGVGSDAVRSFVLDNVRHWIRDFHFDGLRLDAVHALVDDSPTHILTEIKRVAEAEAALAARPVHVIAESHLNDVRLLESPTVGGNGLDAQWSDDFHHCVHALLTGERVGYYVDYADPARQLVKALNDVFVYDGCFSPRFGKPWGKPIRGQSGDRFVVSIQTHDQVGNRPFGDRFGTLLDPARQRLAAGLLLLAPNIPLLFMGEEYGETRPFPFFCDFGDAWFRDEVSRGRRREFAAFYHRSAATMASGSNRLANGTLEPPDPNLLVTFQSAVLAWDWPNDPTKAGLRNLYATLLELRRRIPALRDFVHRSARFENAVPFGGTSMGTANNPRRAISPGAVATAGAATSDSTSVLVLERGDSRRPESQIRAVFNLTDLPLSLPFGIGAKAGFMLHSEEPRFGGKPAEGAFGRFIPPFSFGLCEPSAY